MGGEGLVRAITVPGVDQDWLVSSVGVEESKEENKEESKEESEEASHEAPLALYDDGFGQQVDDDYEERARLAREFDRKLKNPPALNSHALQTFCSGGDDGIVRTWDVQSTSLAAALTPAEKAGAVSCLTACKSRPSLVVSAHHSVKGSSSADVVLWDVRGRVAIHRLSDVHKYEVSNVLLTADGHTLYTAGGSDDPTMKEWDLRMYKKLKNVGYHSDRVTCLGLIQTAKSNVLVSASKDCVVGITTVKKSGVVKSKMVAEISDQEYGWCQSLSMSLMRESAYAGGQAKKGKPDLCTVCSDRVLRFYDLSDFVDLKAKDGATDAANDATDDKGGIEKDPENRKTGLENNYHRKQAEFWDNFNDDSVHAKSATKNEIDEQRRRREKAERDRIKAEHDEAIKKDKYGNEIGSIQYWVAKGCEPKRPKVGDLVILIGDSEPEVNDSDIHVKEDDEAVHIEHLKMERREKIDNLPSEAKAGALQYNKFDLGLVLNDDKSGIPFEVFSGVSGETSWVEEAWIEAASEDHIKAAEKTNGITRATLERRESVAGKRKEEEAREAKAAADDDEAGEDLSAYNEMMGHGGHMGWDGVEEEEKGESKEEEAKGESKEDKDSGAYLSTGGDGGFDEDAPFSLSKFTLKPPNPPDEKKSAAEIKAEEERQAAVQDSLNIYRQQKAAEKARKKAEAESGKGRGVSRF
jgi:hypothetical protein